LEDLPRRVPEHMIKNVRYKQLRLRIYRSVFSSMKNAIIEKAREFGVPVLLINPSHTCRNIKAFLPFTSSTKFVFRILIFVLALVLYSLYTVFKGVVRREEFRLLLILLFFPDLFNPKNFTINLVETLIYTIDLFLRG